MSQMPDMRFGDVISTFVKLWNDCQNGIFKMVVEIAMNNKTYKVHQ